ncbi:MAG: hypothetical protein JJE52_04410 [Acidimicrobiia bacterium]|nr:hypothetical protein [Acidimicrobiia bacterium]
MTVADPTDPSNHARPPGTTDDTVEAVGKLGEAYEYLIRARGHLYSFHQLLGRVDILVGDAAEMLVGAGHDELARMLDQEIVGRNVLDGRWTFQVVEEFDRTYFEAVTAAERRVRDELVAGRRHVFESELKDSRISPGRPAHERRPPETLDPEIETEM